jgi:hypothetical protein
MIVSLKDDAAKVVVPLTSQNIKNMHGVVVASNEATLTLSSDDVDKQVFVATYGRYEVLVSNQNGAIKPGDYVTISALAGIGMKADSDQSMILGKAITGYDGTKNVESTATLTDTSGKKTDVSIGRLTVDVGISHNPLESNAANHLPGFLDTLSTTIADKPVPPIRVYIALLVFAVSAVIAGSMLYSGIRNGMVAIGRNPLAKRSILKNLIQIILISILVFIIGLFGVYLLLKL